MPRDGLIDVNQNGRLPPDRDHSEKMQRAQHALDELLRRVLQPGFTGTGAVELDVHRGGINTVRLQTKELV